MTGSIDLSASVWPDVPSRPLVLVPVGSTEQHGPHLPFDTDTRIATAVAAGVADRLAAPIDSPVVLAPAIAYGASGEHQGFPGTASVGHTALHLTIVELVRSLSTWAGRILLINGHGGNVASISDAVAQMRDEQHDVSWIPCTAEHMTDSHAGLDETSVMLFLAPHVVQMHLAEVGNVRPLVELLPSLTTVGVRPVSPNGVLGNPLLASAARGASLFGALVDSAVIRARRPGQG